MSLQLVRVRKEDLPPGAVLLSREEAITERTKLIQEHQPIRDVYALRYGAALLSVVAATSSLIMLRHFRYALGLRKEAQWSSVMTCTILPYSGSFVYNSLFVTPSIILEDVPCSLCLELQSAGIQTVAGFILPWCYGVVTATMTAYNLGSNVPTLRNPVYLTRLGIHLTRSGTGPVKFGGILFLNVLGAIFLIHAQGSQIIQFNRRVAARRELADN